MDVVSRAAMAALLDLENKKREDTVFIAVLMGPPNPPRIISITPSDVARVKKVSEEEIGAILLERLRRPPSVEERRDILDLVDELYKEGFRVHLLIEDGTDIEHCVKSGRFSQERLAFVIGDHIGFPNELVKEIEKKAYPISLGKRSYLASHCIMYLNEVLDNIWFSYKQS